jgi:hypothetical protein
MNNKGVHKKPVTINDGFNIYRDPRLKHAGMTNGWGIKKNVPKEPAKADFQNFGNEYTRKYSLQFTKVN